MEMPVTEEAQIEQRTAESPAQAQLEQRTAESPAHVTNVEEDIEHLRSADVDPGLDIGQMFPSSPPLLSTPSGIADTSTSLRIPSSVSEPRFGTTDTLQSDMDMPSHFVGMSMETPYSISGDRDDVGTALTDIPEFGNSMESDVSILNNSISL